MSKKSESIDVAAFEAKENFQIYPVASEQREVPSLLHPRRSSLQSKSLRGFWISSYVPNKEFEWFDFSMFYIRL